VNDLINRQAYWSTALISFLCAAMLSRAQTPPRTDLMSMDLEALARVKVYSASRHLEDAKDAPSAVSVITADEIRRYGWRTLADALRSLRGFYTANDRQYTYLGVRGFLRPGDYNSRILILINGHRTNENIYDSGFFGAEFPLDLDLVDHIEVVRGPGSSIYGTNAVFGVVNVITRKPSAQSVVESSGQAASFFDRLARFTTSGSLDKTAALLSFSIDHDPGPSSLYFPQFASSATNNGYAENMDGDHHLQAFGNITDGSFNVQALFSDRRKTYPTASYGAVFNNPADWNEDVRAYIEAVYSHSLASQTDLQIRAYFDNYEYTGSDAYANEGAPGEFIGISKARADWVGVEANVTRPLGAQRISAGAQYEYTIDAMQRNYVVGLPNLFYSNDSPWLTAFYGEAELKLIPHTVMRTGGRLDQYSTFGHALSPRVAVVYTPSEITTVKYILGDAFRAPSAYEEFYADDITIAKAPKELVPEKILSNELVFERAMEPWLEFTADAYYNRLRNLIDQVPDGNSGLSFFVNQGRVHAKGLEFELDAKNRSGFAAKISYALSTAFNDQAAVPLVNSPRSQFKANGAMPLSHYLSAAIGFEYEGTMTDYQGTRVPAYALPTFTLSSLPAWKGWSFSASCYDAINAGWFSPMGPNDPEDKIRMDGRTFRFKLDYKLPLDRKRSEP
jgi:outer membrane receptor for ferrienterochelin and colicins